MKRLILLSTVAGFLFACQTTNTIDLSTYAPVIDIYQYDSAQYETDLKQCRQFGYTVQAKYQEQRKKEQEQAMTAAFIGALAGAAIGNRLDSHDDSGTTVGALYGAGIGASVGADQIDYTRVMAKFGPTAVVDRCMVGRGYKLLSAEGFGGG